MKIDGYLTQAKLTEALESSPKVSLLGTEVRVGTTRKKWDCVIRLGEVMYAVEFDGQGHYQNPTTILSDLVKDQIAREEGYGVIRVPYWIQLGSDTSAHFFGIDLDIITDYPHGFIDQKALLPAAYCSAGLTRFTSELDCLPPSVLQEVKSSLKSKASVLNEMLVVPECLSHLIR